MRLSLKLLFVLPLIAACGEKEGDDSGHEHDDSGHSDDSGHADDSGAAASASTAVVATVANDYSVGALATVGLDDWSVTDSITDISGDPVVVYSGGYLFQLNRYTYDNVRVYEPGSWSEPLSEFALTDLANPHDVEVCEGLAFITQYGRADMAVYDYDAGLLAGTVDLSAFDDGDGTPEASTMVQAPNGKLYVGMQVLDRNSSWANVGGYVAEVDCASKAVTSSWETSGSADVYVHQADPSVVIVSVAGEGLRLLDTSSGALGEVALDTAALGQDIVGLAAYGQRAVAATADPDYSYSIGCVDMSDWSFEAAEVTTNYLISVSGNDRGEAWISARQHWSQPEGERGAIVYDIESCSSLTTDGMVSTSLAPFSVAFY